MDPKGCYVQDDGSCSKAHPEEMRLQHLEGGGRMMGPSKAPESTPGLPPCSLDPQPHKQPHRGVGPSPSPPPQIRPALLCGFRWAAPPFRLPRNVNNFARLGTIWGTAWAPPLFSPMGVGGKEGIHGISLSSAQEGPCVGGGTLKGPERSPLKAPWADGWGGSPCFGVLSTGTPPPGFAIRVEAGGL